MSTWKKNTLEYAYCSESFCWYLVYLRIAFVEIFKHFFMLFFVALFFFLENVRFAFVGHFARNEI